MMYLTPDTKNPIDRQEGGQGSPVLAVGYLLQVVNSNAGVPGVTKKQFIAAFKSFGKTPVCYRLS
jgi:hypothetical protein